MRTIALGILVALAACSGGKQKETKDKKGPGDRCQTFIDRSRPILQKLASDAGKTMTDEHYGKMLADCRAGKMGKDEALADCVVGAADDAAVSQCWEDAFKSYQDDSR
jgi:hypothetical protein